MSDRPDIVKLIGRDDQSHSIARIPKRVSNMRARGGGDRSTSIDYGSKATVSGTVIRTID
jgi:hypothetical protein